MIRTARFWTVMSAAFLGSAAGAHATPTSGSAYFFGDSLTDCCNYGRTSNGPNWSDLLPAQIGASYTASPQSNYAVGGAQSSGAVTSDFLSQIARFTASGTAIGPNDIAGLWIGTNDVWTSSYGPADRYAGQQVTGPIGYQPTAAALTSYIIGNITSGIEQLKADGFQRFVLLSPYDLGQSAVEPNVTAAALATQYSTALTTAESTLSVPGVTIYAVNVQALLQRVQSNPSAFGFQHVLATDNCAANDCGNLSRSAQESYVFQDNIHLTSAFQQLVANQAASVVNAAQSVPEPASAGLLVAGLAGLNLFRRKRPAASARRG